MPHAWWHIIECGSVGEAGETVSPGQWVKYSCGIVAFRAADGLENLVKPHVRKIARIIGDLTDSPVSRMQDLPGGYCGIGIGTREAPVDIPPLTKYQDFFLTVIFDAEGADEAAVAAAHARISIERARAYLKVYEATGGIINLSYGVHYGDGDESQHDHS